jgi:hypothetical protein
MNKGQLYVDAKAALAEASKLESGLESTRAAINAARWRAADDMSQLYDLGETQRAIAATLGVGVNTVSLYLQVYDQYKPVLARGQVTDFGQCLKEVRGGWGHEPITPEKKAERAVNYLSEREVWKDPDVQKVLHTQVRRDIQEQARQPRPKDTKTPYLIVTGTYWESALVKIGECVNLLREATREMDRSGIPSRRGGDLVRQSRALAAAAKMFEERLTSGAIGRSG